MATSVATDKNKSARKQILKFLLIGFPLVILIGLYEDYKDEQYEDRYFKSLDLELIGVVQYVASPSSSNGFGIVGVEVLSSNKLHIDQRDSLQYYYCLVKNGKAELYQRSAHLFMRGDTLTVNSPHRLLSIRHTDGTEPDTSSLELYDNDFFWKYVKKHYQKL